MSRGGSSLKGKSNSTNKVSAPLPVNLPSRRLEKGHDISLVSPGSSWGSPSAVSTAVLGSTSSASSSPATEGASPLLSSASVTASTAQGGGGDPPQPDTSIGSPFQKAAPPRAWGVVAQTPEQHLDEYPTAAEAAKITQEHHDHPGSGGHSSANNNSNSTSNLSTKRTPNNSVTSGEPMAKTVSTLSSGGDNWDEVDEDESEDFLNAAAIEFADGSVVVTAAVSTPPESQKDADSSEYLEPTATISSTTEERIIDRGDVDFNRSMPSRTTGPTLYHPHQESGYRNPSHERSLWQGGPHDRRPSADRSSYTGQRRESIGNREYYPGGPRRDSLGQREPFSGPRRNSSGYRENYERRDSYNRPGSYSRDREPHYHRDGDYTMDRRPSYDRPPYTSDRFPDRHQRDFQLLTRPKESSYERLGPHDTAPMGHRGSQHSSPMSPTARGPHDSAPLKSMDNRAPSYAHLIPPGAVEYDRPAQVTEDQREAMRQAADEARKRREEEEKRFEEAKARAKAKADMLAEKVEAKAKEEEAKKAEQMAKEAEAEAEAARQKVEKETEASQLQDLPDSVKEFGNPRDRPHVKRLTEEDKKIAMAAWQALPDRLAQEDAERVAHLQAKREEERRAKLAGGDNTTPAPAVGARRKGQPSPPGSVPESTGKAEVSVKKEEKTTKDKSTTGSSHPAAHPEVLVEQLDELMHRIEESLHARGTSVQALETNMRKPVDGPETKASVDPTAAASSESVGEETQKSTTPVTEKTTQKERSRNAKASRTERDYGESWRKKDSKAAVSLEDKVPEAAHEDKESGSESLKPTVQPANGRTPRSRALNIGKGGYPAKLNGANGAVKLSDISKIHARLSRQSAGDLELDPPEPNQPQANTDKSTRSPPSKVNAKATTEGAGLKSQSIKRNSLLTSTAATIFPSDVEKAAKNRGRMSFMVESEIETESAPPAVSAENEISPPATETTVAASQWGDGKLTLSQLTPLLNKMDMPSNDDAKKAWDSTTATEHPQEVEIIANATSTSSNIAPEAAMASEMYMVNASVPGVNPMSQQQMWNARSGADPTSQVGTTMAPTGVVMAGPPGGASTGHPVQPFPMVMSPFYHPQGYPVNGPHVYYMYPPRGPMPPPMAQFPSGVMPPHGSMAMPPKENGIMATPDLANQAATLHSIDPTDLKADGANMSTMNLSSSSGNSNGALFLGPHHWLPRFSAAGDAPPQQAPVTQIAASINRAPPSRPFVHHHPQARPLPRNPHAYHPQQHSRIPSSNSGSVSLDSNFQDGSASPTSVDGWSNTSVASGSTNTTSATTGRANGGSAYHGHHHPQHHQQSHRGGYNRDFRPRGGTHHIANQQKMSGFQF
ncbi:hypothetical protein BGZ51_006196 [Haplosporangium sp. Z 767]|nr:hypothetical protein BGZ50_006257 [Haplosporangium sp. Z 11]KAF9180459.1 hypothetical protein BGZ51_006196 [Haplosporangium sp. Z 767]